MTLTMEDEGMHRHIREASSKNLRTTRFCDSDSCKLVPGDTIYELLTETRFGGKDGGVSESVRP